MSGLPFDEAAPHYERASRLIAFGAGGWYRRWVLARAGLRPGMSVLDVGTGTGATARAAARLVGSSRRVTGLDPSPGMLAEAVRRRRAPVVRGVAEALPFCDATFDFLTMGYSVRYLAGLRAAFAECYRVLRPGGTLLILELTRPRTPMAYRLARFYLGRAIPWMARLGSGGRAAQALMSYCWATVDRSVPAEAIREALAACGFEPGRRTVWFGILSEQVAFKPDGRAAHP